MKYAIKFEIYGQSKSEKRNDLLSEIMDEQSETIFNKLIDCESPNRIEKDSLVRIENVEYRVQSIIHEFSKVDNEFYEISVIQVESVKDIIEKNKAAIKSSMSALAMGAQQNIQSNLTKESKSPAIKILPYK